MMSLPVYCRISAVSTSSVYAAVLTLCKRKDQAMPQNMIVGIIIQNNNNNFFFLT